MNEKTRIIIVDDHPIVRQGLRHVIERETDLEVVAEAGDGAEALELTADFQPDVVVLDVDMPKLNGFEVLSALREREAGIKIIMMTVHNEEEFFAEALRLGTNAYLLKDSAVEDLVTAIRAVRAGENYVSRELSQYFFRRPADARPKLPELTAAEKQVLKYIAEYKTNQGIGDLLFIRPLTKVHLSRMPRDADE